MSSAAPANQPPLPQGMLCPKCSYDLSNSPIWTCSECGSTINANNIERFYRRRMAVIGVSQLAYRQLFGAIGVAAAMTLSMAFLFRHWEPALIVGGVCLMAQYFSLAAGWMLSASAPTHDRRAWRLAWLKTHWMLHIPWISIFVFTLLLFVVCGIARLFGETVATTIFLSVVAIELAAWLACGLFALAGYSSRYREMSVDLGLARNRTQTALAILAAIVFLSSVLLGFVGGAVGTMGVAEYFVPSRF